MSTTATAPAAAKKGPGRPKGPAKPKDPNAPIVLRIKLSPDDHKAFADMADKDERTVDNLARVIIKRALRKGGELQLAE